MSPLALLPEAALIVGAVLTLLSGSFLPRRRLWITRVLAAVALLAGAGATLAAWSDPAGAVYGDTFLVDVPTNVARLVIITATLLVIALGADELADDPRQAETCVLLLLSALGGLVLAGAADLAVLAVGFLLSSIPLYGLIGMRRTPRAAEAALKAYLLGALMGIMLLGGATVLFGVGGSTGYSDLATALPHAPTAAVGLGVVAVVGGLTFKIGAVPGHFWVPDAAQGATTTVAAFLTTVPKIAALLAAYRLVELTAGVVDTALLVGILAAMTMTLGNLAAFQQHDPRRLLGWSTVSQAGYLLLPVAAAGRSTIALPALLIYLGGYMLSNLAAFAVVAAEPDRADLAGYRGLARARPWLAAALLVGLLSLVGTPPTAVFAGKLAAFTAAWDGGQAWLVVIAAANTVASLFYYLRWIAPAFRTDPSARGPAHYPHPTRARSPRRWATTTALVAAAGALTLGIAGALAWPLLGA